MAKDIWAQYFTAGIAGARAGLLSHLFNRNRKTRKQIFMARRVGRRVDQELVIKKYDVYLISDN
ncbi:MAG: hypothetical protein JO328_11605 [Hyphomicrobiales bacterium]|nr:hypothetical protein [Hyphomicrobiales bacterium]